jgi:CubicO group peptidase (beta-lactamase class C family)
MKKRVAVVVVLVMICTVAIAPSQTGKEKDSQNALRIRAVENGLVEFRPGVPASDAPPPKLWALAERMTLHKIPGISIAVIDNNTIAWAKGYGLLKAGNPLPVTPKSFFEAASTSKAVTAALVMHFVDKGKLTLDQDVNGYLKSWNLAENEWTKEKKVTLRYLLTHQAGMPATNFPHDETIGMPTLLQVLKGELPAKNKPAVVGSVPGSLWNYSNIGYVVIQQILEDIAGKPFDQIAREVLFQPLGMTSSTFVYPLRKDLRESEAVPHDDQGKACLPAMPGGAVAQGGLMTTPTELALFAIELMRAFQGKSDRILSQKSVQAMIHKELDLDPRMFGFPLGEGLGVFLQGTGKELSFLHPGSNDPGATSWLVAYPELGKGAIIMTNGVNGDLFSLEILPALGKAHGWPPAR